MTGVFGAGGPPRDPAEELAASPDPALTGGYDDAEVEDDAPAGPDPAVVDDEGVHVVTDVGAGDPDQAEPDQAGGAGEEAMVVEPPDEDVPRDHNGRPLPPDHPALKVGPDGLTIYDRDRLRAGRGFPSQPRFAYDWPTIKRRYVEGYKTNDKHEWPSMTQVAEHFQVSPHTVRERAAREKWTDQRATWQRQVEHARQVARAGALSKAGMDLDNAALDASKLGLQLVIAALRDDAADVQDRRQKGGPGSRSGVDVLRQTRIAQAADLWHKIGLRAIGDPEVRRVELTGADGRPLEIATELRRDDPARMTNVLEVLAQAGLDDLFAGQTRPRHDTPDEDEGAGG